MNISCKHEIFGIIFWNISNNRDFSSKVGSLKSQEKQKKTNKKKLFRIIQNFEQTILDWYFLWRKRLHYLLFVKFSCFGFDLCFLRFGCKPQSQILFGMFLFDDMTSFYKKFKCFKIMHHLPGWSFEYPTETRFRQKSSSLTEIQHTAK